jgi:hypothetical protein
VTSYIDEAKEFATWKRDDTVDNTHKCNNCGKYYDYRIFMVHKCDAVAFPDYGYIRTV